jgi:hypothetical protein
MSGRYPTSDIDICYSDIGDKYVGLKTVIPISEVFRYQHQSSFRYPTLKKTILQPSGFEPPPLGMVSKCYNTKLRFMSVQVAMSDIGYRRKLYSNIRYNIGLHFLSPNIGSSDIRLNPISLVTDSGLSGHLW